MNGEGYVLIDITLTVLAFFAAFAQILNVRQEWAATRCANFSTLLRLAGWFVLSVRFSHLLLTHGDLPVGAPSIVALICLALAEITAAALHERK
jgi:hypothetical protein